MGSGSAESPPASPCRARPPNALGLSKTRPVTTSSALLCDRVSRSITVQYNEKAIASSCLNVATALAVLICGEQGLKQTAGAVTRWRLWSRRRLARTIGRTMRKRSAASCSTSFASRSPTSTASLGPSSFRGVTSPTRSQPASPCAHVRMHACLLPIWQLSRYSSSLVVVKR